jgi:hypothetical protein
MAGPWVKADSPFKHVRHEKLKNLWQLTLFNKARYKLNPVVNANRFRTQQQLNRIIQWGPSNHNFTNVQWMAIINSIPNEWLTVLTAGNQTHANGEFFATIRPNGNIRDVYMYKYGGLHHYTMEADGKLTNQNNSGQPGVFGGNHPWPSLTELKRLRVVETQARGPAAFRLISYMFPSATDQSLNSNILTNSYSHPLFTGDYRDMAKTWRSSLFARHRDTEAFANVTFGDPQYDLSKLTTQFNLLLTPSKQYETLWKLMNNSLYVGNVAYAYQTSKKKVPIGSDKLVSRTCIFYAHQYNAQYRPMFHKPQGLVVPTYQHIFWGSLIAKTLWAYADHVNGFT